MPVLLKIFWERGGERGYIHTGRRRRDRCIYVEYDQLIHIAMKIK